MCHGRLLSESLNPTDSSVSKDVRTKRFQRLSGSKVSNADCQLRGLRGSEFAVGQHFVVFEKLLGMGTDTVLRLGAEVVSVTDLEKVTTDWDLGKMMLEEEVRDKLRFWSTLPWLVAGLAHHDVEKAKACARRVEVLLKAEENPALHHRIARRFFSHPELRQQLRDFAAVHPPQVLSHFPALQAFALKYKLLPVSERPIERPHALISKSVMGKRKRHPVTISFANRILEVKSRMQEPTFVEAFASLFSTIGNSRSIARLLNLHRHPAIADQFLSTEVHIPPSLCKAFAARGYPPGFSFV